MRKGFALSFLFCLAAASLSAQNTTQDTSIIRTVGTGFTIDFVEQDVRTVINAIADIAGLNISTANIPANLRTSLRLTDPIRREDIPGVLKGIVERVGLQWTEENGIYFVQRAPAPGRGGGQQTAAVNPVDMQYIIIPLRHQNNVTLAQVLTAVFATTNTGRGGQINFGNTANQGRGQNQGRAGGAAGGGAGGGRGGGRGGGGGGGGGGEDIPLTTSSLDPSLTLAGDLDAGMVRELLASQDVRAAERQRVLQELQGQGAVVLPQGAGGLQGLGALLGGQAQQALQAVQQIAGAQGTDPRFVPIDGTNQIVIRALPADMAMIQAVIAAVDLRPLQVLIEVSIVEVRRSSELNVGVSGTGNYTKQGDTDPRATATLARPQAFDNARDFVLALSGGRGTVDFNLALQALSTRGDVKVASLPVIFAQNNRQAQLIVGEQRPFVQTTQLVPNDNGVVNQVVQYRDVATNLLITPTINPDGYVNMDIDQQVQDVTSEVQFDAPVISTRRAVTSLFVRSGQTAVIGGLASNREDNVRTGIPILSSIPILGAIFGSTRKTDVVTELYLFLTPHVVQTDQDTDFINNAVRANSQLIKDFPLRQLVPQPDTTIRVIIPPDTAQMTRIPQRVDTTGRRIPPDTGAARRIPPDTGTRTIPPLAFGAPKFMRSNRGEVRQ